MFFNKKRIDRAMNLSKEKNKLQQFYSDNEDDNDIELEKSDILAVVISALLVFGPILLIMIIMFMFISRW
jgi:hypothetical protein